MTKARKPYAIQITSQYADDRYNKKSSADKRKAMGGNDLIQRKFFGENEED